MYDFYLVLVFFAGLFMGFLWVMLMGCVVVVERFSPTTWARSLSR